MCSNNCKQPTLIYGCNNQSWAWQHFSGNCGCPGFSESSLTCRKSSRAISDCFWGWTFSLSAFIYWFWKKEPCLFSMDLVTINPLILLRLCKEFCSHFLLIFFFFFLHSLQILSCGPTNQYCPWTFWLLNSKTFFTCVNFSYQMMTWNQK